ncbi:MAG: hypothetical protein HZB66_01090 [Candidatus Aenigmarchaeota archaeon]|nr:hypothetical protein [Candidatus Aenigmarchaeota archaeon]
MRVVKRFQKDLEHIDLISGIFDQVIRKFYYNLFIDRIEFILSDKNGFEIGDRSAKIFLNANDNFVRVGDQRAIRALILHQIAHIIVRQKGMETDQHHIEDVLANKELIKNGFSDDLFYYYYQQLIKKPEIKSFHEYLEINVPWLSFMHGKRHHDSMFLLKLARQIQHPSTFHTKGKKILKHMKRDLWDDEILRRTERHIKSRMT